MEGMEHVVVYDLATLRFRRSARKTSMSVIAASGEVLAVCDTSVADTNEDAAYAVCEHALSAGRVQRGEHLCRVALYNPYSAEISYLPAPESVVFGNEQGLALPVDGEVATVHEDSDGMWLALGGVRVGTKVLTVAGASRAWGATEDHDRR